MTAPPLPLPIRLKCGYGTEAPSVSGIPPLDANPAPGRTYQANSDDVCPPPGARPFYRLSHETEPTFAPIKVCHERSGLSRPHSSGRPRLRNYVMELASSSTTLSADGASPSTSYFSSPVPRSSNPQEDPTANRRFTTVISVPQPVHTGEAITRIEGILMDVLTGLANGAEALSITIKGRSQHPPQVDSAVQALPGQAEPDGGMPARSLQQRLTQVSYPGRTEEESKRFGGYLTGASHRPLPPDPA